jgi:predicted amidophosphoribosyltransferase
MMIALGYAIVLALVWWMLRPVLGAGPAPRPSGFCPNCGAPTLPDARFCAECGAPLPR